MVGGYYCTERYFQVRRRRRRWKGRREKVKVVVAVLASHRIQLFLFVSFTAATTTKRRSKESPSHTPIIIHPASRSAYYTHTKWNIGILCDPHACMHHHAECTDDRAHCTLLPPHAESALSMLGMNYPQILIGW